jgi:hypothetical protein
MARTIAEISNYIKTGFISSQNLRNLYGLEEEYANSTIDNAAFYDNHFSQVSIETIIINIVAVVAATIENMFDWFTADIKKIVESERYGHAGWYKKMALLFQFGENINNEYSPESTSDFAESAIYANENPELQVIKYAFAESSATGTGVNIKIAGETDGELSPLTSDQIKAFTAYMNRIKPAGIPLNIINRNADRLIIELTIYYNPLVLDSDGSKISDGSRPVEEAINGYLNSIEFNGEFINMKIIDAIQQAIGVEIAELTRSAQQHEGYPVTDIEVKFTPDSGYMRLDFENDLFITYIPRFAHV